MSLNKVLKIKSMNYLHWCDLTRDGAFNKPRIKGKNKKMITRARRLYDKRMSMMEVGD